MIDVKTNPIDIEGFYSFAEIGESITRESNFMVHVHIVPDGFTDKEIASLKAIISMVKALNCTTSWGNQNMEQLADMMNRYYDIVEFSEDHPCYDQSHIS